MKTYYTEKELKRFATEKAIEILQENKDMILTNTSYGGVGGLTDVFVAFENEGNYYNRKGIYIGLKGNWHGGEEILAVVEYEHEQTKTTQEIMKVYCIRTYKGKIYLTNEEDYKKHVERRTQRYKREDKRIFKEYFLAQDSDITKALLEKIQNKTGKKIKPQSLKVNKYNGSYKVFYTYRNKLTSIEAKVRKTDKHFLYWV